MKKPAAIDPRILELCEGVTDKRPRTVIDHIIKHGQITTDELKDIYGYNHPPRAARDVRENGIPLDTTIHVTEDGRRVGVYSFADPSKIKGGRIGGRKVFSKAFKADLVAAYGEKDHISGERMESRYLQIDHRIPYEVAGDDSRDPADYMLIDASNQRAKSWSCEHCRNFLEIHDAAICRGCFWAWPEDYEHIAMEQERRLVITWQGDAVEVFDRLKDRADQEGTDVREVAKRILSEG